MGCNGNVLSVVSGEDLLLVNLIITILILPSSNPSISCFSLFSVTELLGLSNLGLT